MYDLRARCERGGIAGHAIVEPHADAHDEIGRLDGLVDVHFAVHSRHAEVQIMRLRECADAEQRGDHRRAGALRELPHLRVRAAHDHAVADHEEGTLSLGDELCHLLDGVADVLGVRCLVSGLPQPLTPSPQPQVFSLLVLHVFRYVHEHGAGPPLHRNRHGLTHVVGQIFDVAHEHVVLGDGQRHTDDVGLLKGVAAEHRPPYLTGDRKYRRAVHVRRRQSGDEIGRARTGRRHAHAHAVARARIAVRRMRGRLFVPHEDVARRLLAVERVVKRHDRAAGVAEHHLDARVCQCAAQDLRAGQELAHELHSPVVAAAQRHRLKAVGVVSFVEGMHQRARARLDDVRGSAVAAEGFAVDTHLQHDSAQTVASRRDRLH